MASLHTPPKSSVLDSGYLLAMAMNANVVCAIPDGNIEDHVPPDNCLRCKPIAGLSICGNCGTQVDLIVHQRPDDGEAVAKAALRELGNLVAQGYHGSI